MPSLFRLNEPFLQIESYRPVSDYRPLASSYQEPEYHNSLPVQNYEQVHVPELNYGAFKPVSSYEPVSSYTPIQPFSEPEIDSYGPPAAPPIYETVKPIYEQPAVVRYGTPISTYEPSLPLYEAEQEPYGTPIASPINTFIPTSNPGLDKINNFTLVHFQQHSFLFKQKQKSSKCILIVKVNTELLYFQNVAELTSINLW